MTSVAVTSLHLVGDEDGDCAAEMDKALGDLSGMAIFGEQVLVGMFLRGGKSAGGILIPDMARTKEDIFQGKVARVLAIGPGCWEWFKGAASGKWSRGDMKGLHSFLGGRELQVGDWIFTNSNMLFSYSYRGAGAQEGKLLRDAADRSLKGWPCALIYLNDIYGRIDDPRSVV